LLAAVYAVRLALHAMCEHALSFFTECAADIAKTDRGIICGKSVDTLALYKSLYYYYYDYWKFSDPPRFCDFIFSL